MHNSLTIKNLSITVEALSRVCGAEEHLERVKDLLMDEIKAAEEKSQIPPPPQTPNLLNPNDDIPF